MIPLDIPLPSGWSVASLDDVSVRKGLVSGPFGSAISKKYFVDTGVPVIRGSNLSTDGWFVDEGFVFITDKRADELANAEVLPGDLVFTAAGTLGQVGLLPLTVRFPRYIASNKQLRARIDPDLADARYVFYWFRIPSVAGFVASMNRGSSVPLLTLGVLRDLPVPVPPLEEQRRIADFIESIDLLIENNRRRIEILEEMARLIYREWFVHFRFPGHEDVQLIESDLGAIPEGWGVTSLAKHVELQRRNVKPADYSDEEFDHYSIPAFDADRLPVVEPASEIKSGKYRLDGNCVLLSKLNPRFARVWRASPGRSPRRSICSTEFLVLEATGDWPDPFVFSLVSAADFGARLASMAGGTSTSHQRAGPKEVMALAVVGPPRELVATFSDRVRPMLNLVDNLLLQKDVLSKARDLLLPRLISGELDVSDLDLDLEPVA